MRILIFNWKDIRHPFAGGAELVTHEYAKCLIKLGHEVSLFTSQSPNTLNAETVDGVDIIRRGNFATVYLWAAYIYFTSLRHKTGLVIDQIHGLPFFTPLFVRKPILAWIHEIAGPIWFKEFPWPVALLGNVVEHLYLNFYKNTPFLTDSPSTKKELIKFGLSEKNISVIPLTIDKYQIPKVSKTKIPSLIYVGRLSPMKRIDFLIYATRLLCQKYPQLKTYIVGKGKTTYEVKLRNLVGELQLQSNVYFLGHVPEAKKRHLFASSWIHIHPSIKEGFGLTVLEAAACATPTVCFQIPGLIDMVKTNKNGIVVNDQSPTGLTLAIESLLSIRSKLSQLSHNTRKWFEIWPTWESQSQKLEKLLQKIYDAAL